MFDHKALLAVGSAAVLLAAGFAIAHPGERGPSPEKRREFVEKRLSKLPPQEQELARQVLPLRDSLMRTIGDYKRKVHDGAQPRSLVSQRATIQSLQSRIWALEAQNPDVTLDLLADLPGPFDGPHHHGPHCPRGAQLGDSLPPPPQDD